MAKLRIFKKPVFWLILILALAAFLRFYKIGQVPPSLNWDEVAIGYNAYSILKTSKDEWGVTFPLLGFESFGEYKLPLLFTRLSLSRNFGLNELGVICAGAFGGHWGLGRLSWPKRCLKKKKVAL